MTSIWVLNAIIDFEISSNAERIKMRNRDCSIKENEMHRTYHEGRLIEVEKNISLDLIDAILAPDSQVLAIRVSNYIPKYLCEKFAASIEQNASSVLSSYASVPTLPVTKTGIMFGEASMKPELIGDYFDTAARTEATLREHFAPYVSPIDKLRTDLDQVWPGGAQVARIHGKRMLSGIVRSTADGGDIPAHQDNITEEYPDVDWQPSHELVSNVYLSMPGGGELEIYDFSPAYADTAMATYDGDRFSQTNELLTEDHQRDLASKSSVVMTPQVGDLILFSGRNVHRVHPVRSGARMTTCFHIGVLDRDRPLQCWA
jgi:hypothetical protein